MIMTAQYVEGYINSIIVVGCSLLQIGHHYQNLESGHRVRSHGQSHGSFHEDECGLHELIPMGK